MKMILSIFSLFLALHFIRRVIGVICSFLLSFNIYILTLFIDQFQNCLDLDTIMEFVELQRGDAKAR